MDVTINQVGELIDTVLRVRFTDLERERECCEEILTFAKEQGSTYARAFAYTYLGDYYLGMNDSVNSGPYLAKAREFCNAQTYPDLYMKACHLSGFYYHVINDEQNALQYYMEAQAIATELGDAQQICNSLNNIADIFERHGNYEQANHYFILAYKSLLDQHCDDVRLKIMLEFNLAINSGFIGDLDEMQRYLNLCDQNIPLEEGEIAFHRICCLSGRCQLEAYRGHAQAALDIANHILDDALYGLEEYYAIMELLTPVANSMVTLKEQECAKRYIDLLSQHCTINEILPMQHLIELNVRYAETFSCDLELFDSYKNYYLTMQKIIEAEDGVRVRGMNAKINLLNMIKQHESALKENERLVDVANLDELTGIYNRRYFNQRIHEEKSTENNAGIIMLDIDYFKQFNDTYGHISGDFALREVAKALKNYATDEIIPCRYGGDEFVCICIDTSDERIESYITQVITHIKNLAIPNKESKCSTILTLSIGYDNRASNYYGDMEIVMRQADKALYLAKEDGRNCWRKCAERRLMDNQHS